MNEQAKLKLSDEVTHDVIATCGSDRFIGVLKITPNRCTIRIMGERIPKLGIPDPEKIECQGDSLNFLLFELRLISARQRSLRSTVNNELGFFEYEYEVSYLLTSESNIVDTDVSCITLSSPLINKWIGHTNTQSKLLNSYHDKSLFNSKQQTTEVTVELCGIGSLAVAYDPKVNAGITGFSSGFTCYPSIYLRLNRKVSIPEAYTLCNHLYDLMAYIMGGDFEVESIRLSLQRNHTNQSTYLYYPSGHRLYQRDYPVLLLGHNLRFNDLNLPMLPLSIFSIFFALDDTNKMLFEKYQTYKRMHSREEVYLGYFRILEKLTYKTKSYVCPEKLEALLNECDQVIIEKLENRKGAKGLIQRIKSTNKSKYNTEKCIIDFVKTIPPNITENLRCKNADIQSMCKLRNDITHANHYYISKVDLDINIQTVETLLYLALFSILDSKPDTGAQFVHRLNNAMM